MAYEIKNIDPLDLKKVGIGVSIPFNGPGVFNTTYTTQDQLKSNIINYLLTNVNERMMNPNFGGNLRGLLFEQITDGNLQEAKLAIEQTLEREFKNVEIKELKLLGSPDQNKIYFSIKYSIPNSNINDEISIFLNE